MPKSFLTPNTARELCVNDHDPRPIDVSKLSDKAAKTRLKQVSEAYKIDAFRARLKLTAITLLTGAGFLFFGGVGKNIKDNLFAKDLKEMDGADISELCHDSNSTVQELELLQLVDYDFDLDPEVEAAVLATRTNACERLLLAASEGPTSNGNTSSEFDAVVRDAFISETIAHRLATRLYSSNASNQDDLERNIQETIQELIEEGLIPARNNGQPATPPN